jgi:hypothetical protein
MRRSALYIGLALLLLALGWSLAVSEMARRKLAARLAVVLLLAALLAAPVLLPAFELTRYAMRSDLPIRRPWLFRWRRPSCWLGWSRPRCLAGSGLALGVVGAC